MFSANENLQLRKHKRRIVQAVEATMSEEVLDLGVNVMVMQVACQDPGCVPIETAIIIVFPASDVELIPGLPQSAGGSYKTKILKPMADVETPHDVLEALPPQFEGGLRTVARLALSLRDVVLAQIQQSAGNAETDAPLRKQLAEYLQASLEEYIQHDCVPPPTDKPYADDVANDTAESGATNNAVTRDSPKDSTSQAPSFIPAKGNVVLKRPAKDDDVDDDKKDVTHPTGDSNNVPSSVIVSTNPETAIRTTPSSSRRPSHTPSSRPFDSVSRRRQQAAATRELMVAMSGTAAPKHARGVRRVGCPCCDPDNPSNVVDQMMQL